MTPTPPPQAPSEAELHALVDGQLTAERARELEAWLLQRPAEARRVADYRAQRRALQRLFDPVLGEAVPPHLLKAAGPRRPWYERRLVAGLAMALLGGGAGWGLHATLVPPAPTMVAEGPGGFAQRAAVAHAVYSPDQRRPVEVDAAHEEQLVTWLSKRMGAPMKPPRLQALGYALEGGRLLPGGQGPVAQFMYRDADGAKLTVYVSREAGKPGAKPGDAGFSFLQDGAVNVFYWIDGPFGYAISAGVDKTELARLSSEIYRQLKPPG